MERRGSFLSIHSAGAILPPDMLYRIASEETIGGLSPVDYHLAQGERLGEAVTRSWTRLAGLWAGFNQAKSHLSETNPVTTLTRERLLLPLFQELGYGRLQTARAVEIEGKTYPVSHGWSNVPIHLVGHGISLERRTKGVAGAAAQSPHALVQELLNRSAEKLYGFVANGRALRLLRDNNSLTRQAYVEFDLAQMFDNDLYADFFLLWLVCHQSRFEGEPVEECWLERWSKRAETEGTRALEDLRKGVEEAISSLGRGFLANPANGPLRERLRAGTLTKNDYYQQVLRSVYRLIFLFVAEDRGVLLDIDAEPAAQQRFLRFYSTARLRELAGKIRGTRHSDLYDMLKVVFAALGSPGGAPGLALGALGSFLWSGRATPDLDDACLSNTDLLVAVRALSIVNKAGLRRSIDYRNLGSEELGSVYESLLELHPEIQIDATAHEDRFKLGTVTGHERRTTGSYYTPRELVSCLLDTALDPVLDEAGRSSDPAGAILALKVCDPAAGSGHFLISAAHRMAKRLAAARSGEDEPAPAAIRQALRDVISHCLYAVDINPMAVELCKISLWMESVDPGQPLSFLDSHIKTGNSLLGTTSELIEAGIPDGAFSPITGDEKEAALSLKRQNKLERTQQAEGKVQLALDVGALTEVSEELAERTRDLAGLPESSMAAVQRKEEAHAALRSSDTYVKAKLTADAWCSAFFQDKGKHAPLRITQGTVRRLSEDLNSVSAADRSVIAEMAAAYEFFHWHVEFPEVFGADGPGGFDVVLGNPPWERVKLQEKEFFASRMPEILQARNKAARQKLIDRLQVDDPALYNDFVHALRKAEGESHFIRNSARYPLCGRGDVNTYSIFGEAMRSVASATGRSGCVLPTGIATDDTTKNFFADLVDKRSLVSLFDFENRRAIFPGVHRSYKFCLLTLTGLQRPSAEAEFVFFAQAPSDLADRERRFTLAPEDFVLLNPNTRTCPIFRTRRDAEITKGIYRRVPVLIDQARGAAGNLWGVSFLRMLDMSNDSGLFRVRTQLQAEGFSLEGNAFVKGRERWLPLYEAKMVHHFNHRFGDYALAQEGSADTHLPDIPEPMMQDPDYAPLPRYWVPESDVDARLAGRWDAGWLLGWRDICRSTDVRTLIASVIPRVGAGDTLLLALPSPPQASSLLLANFDSIALDYATRQKIGGTHLKFHVFKQLPVFVPKAFDLQAPWSTTGSVAEWLKPRVLELAFTSWDLGPFARDLGCNGPPFRWNPERRFLLRCELDAAFFHLYGVSEDDTEYIMETFPIVKKKDVARFGEYRTKDQVLAIYRAMAHAATTGLSYRAILDPPAADPSVAHPPRVVPAQAAMPRLRLIEFPAEADKYRTVVPIVDLKAAAGSFGEVQPVESLGWAEIPGHKPREGMFVAQVLGHSMEPRIWSGSYCLFCHPADGSSQGRVVLVQHRDIWDPETGGSYTVKRYSSKKVYRDDGTWEHTQIRLEPLNPAYDPIIITEVEEGELRLIAEFVDAYPEAMELE